MTFALKGGCESDKAGEVRVIGRILAEELNETEMEFVFGGSTTTTATDRDCDADPY